MGIFYEWKGRTDDLGVVSSTHFDCLQKFHLLLPEELHVRCSIKILSNHHHENVLFYAFTDGYSLLLNFKLKFLQAILKMFDLQLISQWLATSLVKFNYIQVLQRTFMY